MSKLTYDELLENYRLLVGLVMDLKAEKEAYIEASREVNEHSRGLSKKPNNDILLYEILMAQEARTSKANSESAQKLLDLQHEIDHKIAQVDKKMKTCWKLNGR